MTDYETAVVLRLIAEEVCDRVMGEGTYEKINGFSPKKLTCEGGVSSVGGA